MLKKKTNAIHIHQKTVSKQVVRFQFRSSEVGNSHGSGQVNHSLYLKMKEKKGKGAQKKKKKKLLSS